ncbi:MAG TPA: hypothetical protein VNJ47_00260 [Nevskiales bacterium]|nr:hypothetical protein [Nevskiales bacterium]
MGRRARGAELGAKREPGGFSAWPRACARSENFYRLSYTARSLLFEFLTQYSGANNGDLTCAWTVLRVRGWNSKSTIQFARDELLRTGWIVVTRYGGLGVTELYALTFFDIDECQGKVDPELVGRRLSYWRTGRNLHYLPKKKAAAKMKSHPDSQGGKSRNSGRQIPILRQAS